MQKKMKPHDGPEKPSSSSERCDEGKPGLEPKEESPSGFARVPHPTGCAFWGKVWGYGAKLHETPERKWLSFAIYVRQPGNTHLTVFVNWQDYTWIPAKKDLVICQGTPILRLSEEGNPFFVLRCYGSKGVRKAYSLT